MTDDPDHEGFIVYRKAVWPYRDAFKQGKSTEQSRVALVEVYKSLTPAGKKESPTAG